MGGVGGVGGFGGGGGGGGGRGYFWGWLVWGLGFSETTLPPQWVKHCEHRRGKILDDGAKAGRREEKT